MQKEVKGPQARGQRRRAKEDAKKAENGSRTHNLRFTKPLLCQLSYLGANIFILAFFPPKAKRFLPPSAKFV